MSADFRIQLSRDIAATFGGSTKTIWLTQVIGIITASLAPPVAQASDFWGRKWTVIIFIVLGAVGAIIMSRASSMNNVIAGAVISGLVYGSNGVLHAIFSEILPRRWRTTAQAITYVVVAGSSIFGLMIGTYLVMRYDEGWRIFFYIVAGFLVFSAVLTAFFYNPPPRELQLQLSFKEKVQRVSRAIFEPLC